MTTIASASIELGVDASGVDSGLGRVENSVRSAGRTLDSLGRQGTSALNEIGTSSTNAARNMSAAERSMLSSLQRQEAALRAGANAGSRYAEEFASLRGIDLSGPVGAAINNLRALEASQTRVGVSAAQTAAAMRGVPAQLTDIVTSLQGGQAPLTVFLQQGGQLRDMFGSAGGAARALGGAVIGMINPFTIAAGAAVAAAVAYNQGSQESDAYRKSIILTGNAAGVTAGQLATMAKKASEVSGTQSANAEALAALVGTGKVGADGLLRASTTAVQAQKYLGIAVSDTVKAYADLAKDPLQTTLKLNDQYNYLTLSTYKQIKALTEQGKTTEAAKVAQEAFGAATDEMSKKAAASLGSLEKAWNSTKDAAKSAWDRMLDIGREDSLDDKIKKAQEKLEKANAAYYKFTGGTTKEKDADKEEAQRQLDRLQNMKKVEEMSAQYAAEDNKRRDAAVKFDQEGVKYLSQQEKLKKEIAEADNLARQAAERGEKPEVTEARVQARIKEIRASYADYFNQSIEAQIAGITRLGAVQEEQAKRAFLPIQAQNDAGLNKALDKQFAYIDAVAKRDEEALLREKNMLQQKLVLAQKETVATDGQFAHQQKLAELRGQIAQKDQQILSRRAQQQEEIYLADKKNTDAINQAYAAMFDSRQNDLIAIEKQIRAQRDQNETIGMSASELATHNTKLTEEIALRLEGEAAVIAGNEARKEEAEVLRKSAQRMRDLNAAQIEGATKQFDFEKTKALWESIDRTAHDTFVSIFDSGKSAFDRLRDTLKNGLLDMLYQMTLKKWIFSVGASMTGYSGLANAAGQTLSGGNAASGLGSAFSAVGAATSMYNAISGGFAGLSGAVTEGVQSAINLLGPGTGFYSEAGSGLAASAPATMAGAAASYLAGMGIGHTVGNMIAGDYSIGSHGQAITNVSSIVGAVLGGPIGGAIGGAVGGLLNRAFGMGDVNVTSRTWSGTLSDAGASGNSIVATHQDGGWFRSDRDEKITKTLTSDITNTLAAGFSNLKQVTSGFAKDLGVSTSALEGLSKEFNIALTEDATKNQEAITAYFKTLGDELATTLVPTISSLSTAGETAAATLERLSGEFVSTSQAATLIGKTAAEMFGSVGIESAKARENLLKFAGGAQSLSSQATVFAQNFLTEEERIAPVAKALNEAMASIGLSGVTTREQFKAIVQGLDATTEAGAKQLASMLSLAEAFAQVHPAIEETAKAARSAADILAERNDLQKQLDNLTLTSAELLAKQRDALDESNRALFDQVQAATAAKDAEKIRTDAAKAASDAIAKAAESAAAERAAMLQSAANNIASAYDAQASALQNVVKAQQDAIESSKKYAESLTSGSLSNLSEGDRLSVLKSQYLSATNQSDFQSAATSYLELLRSTATSQIEYSRGLAGVQLANSKFISDAQSKASDAQMRYSSLGDIYGNLLAAVTGQQVASVTTPVITPTKQADRTSQSNDSLATEVKKMGDKLAGLLEQVVTQTEKTAMTLDYATEGGNSLVPQ